MMPDINNMINDAIKNAIDALDAPIENNPEPQSDRNELELLVERGRRYGSALEALKDFIEAEKHRVIQSLEFHEYTSQDELNDLLAKLRVLRDFVSLARLYYKLGEEAEEELNKEGG